MEVVVTTGPLEIQVVQRSSQIITTNKPTSSFFTGRMPFLSPNQQCQSTEGKSSPEPNGENQKKKITTWVDKIL